MDSRKGISPWNSSPPQVTKISKKKESTDFTIRKVLVTVAVVVVVLAVGVQYVYVNYYYLPNQISTKSKLPTVSTKPDPRIWGTYRSHLYFGLRARYETSPLFGMMWYRQPGIEGQFPRIRHWCKQGNGVTKYAWTLADGHSFGLQTIHDESLDIFTDWINDGPVWTVRVTTTSNVDSNFALLFYFALQDDNSKLHSFYQYGELNYFTGESDMLGNFTVNIDTTVDLTSRSFLALKTNGLPDVSTVEDIILSSTLVDRSHRKLRLPSAFFSEDSVPGNEPRLIVLQLNILSNSSTEISFSVGEKKAIRGDDFSKLLEQRTKEFNDKFEAVYGLSAKGYPDFYQELGRVALSNMLGTIGYAYGSNRVQSSYSSKQSLYGPHSLLSTCPSRSVFPRGFLWDEGFHQLLLMKFDPDLSLEIVASWLDTMNVDGWIPREMILGKEAELRVPAEFIVQRDTMANPPMLFYLIEKFLDHSYEEVVKFYPRLSLWHKWLNSTQHGKKNGTYRWRGRNATTNDELNPRTLPSGLDDYPRATHPTDDEYHVDLCCWMALSARVLSKLAKLAGDSQNEEKYLADYNFLMDFNRFDNLHWSKARQRYCDYGLHSNNVKLEKKSDNEKVKRGSSYSIANEPMKRVAKTSPKLQLIENAFGYVSLFPVLLKFLPHDSDKLRVILENVKSEGLWSDFGLRSIAPSSPYYRAHNTEHDPPYWRGSVWININYLMLAALKHYSAIEGPNRELAFGIYSDLRNNLVTNVAREFRRTGFLWENYNDETGHGQGAHPFTGWSSLVLSIMAEQYD
ncbi:mannosyl oligosaccharide glucosidase [Loa loa]|uniref:Mannosyl-oligosaccharide glucosidase n=1 Tax=Loa loa TaxID=7209 RepID=A0A1I7W3L7_LOALO|nr:mannosyl oligosaccharide glucosidase [Loa loa]EFO24790.2 mannosyl oligosaccharide glucosidase [Loa loa]